MKKSNWLAALVGCAVAAAALAGCSSVDSGNPQPGRGTDAVPVGTTQSALTVLEMDEAAGKLELRFEQGGRSISFHLRLGPAMAYPPSAEELAADPEQASYEVDALVKDGNGQIIHVQLGGDVFLDKSWRFPPVTGFDEAARVEDIQLIKAAVPALRQLSLPTGLEQLRLSAIGLGLGIDASSEKASSGATVSGQAGTLAPQAVENGVTAGKSSVTQWDYQVWRHDLAHGAGEHSAVQLRGWSSTKIVFYANSCNHGACAGNTKKSTIKCTYSGYLRDDGTHTRFFYNEQSTDEDIAGGCTTSENWTSVYSHNCNDDSELQIKAIHADAVQSRTSGSCHNLGPHISAPACRN